MTWTIFRRLAGNDCEGTAADSTLWPANRSSIRNNLTVRSRLREHNGEEHSVAVERKKNHYEQHRVTTARAQRQRTRCGPRTQVKPLTSKTFTSALAPCHCSIPRPNVVARVFGIIGMETQTCTTPNRTIFFCLVKHGLRPYRDPTATLPQSRFRSANQTWIAGSQGAPPCSIHILYAFHPHSIPIPQRCHTPAFHNHTYSISILYRFHTLFLSQSSAIAQLFLKCSSANPAIPQLFLSYAPANPQPFLNYSSANPVVFLSQSSAIPQLFLS